MRRRYHPIRSAKIHITVLNKQELPISETINVPKRISRDPVSRLNFIWSPNLSCTAKPKRPYNKYAIIFSLLVLIIGAICEIVISRKMTLSKTCPPPGCKYPLVCNSSSGTCEGTANSILAGGIDMNVLQYGISDGGD